MTQEQERIPEPAQPIEEGAVNEVEPEEEAEAVPVVEPVAKPKDDMSDLFEVPQPEDNDMVVDHLVEPPEEEDMSDLVDVSQEDLMGELPKPKPKPVARFRRTVKPYTPPPPTGVREIR